jgi:hypothetical protein
VPRPPDIMDVKSEKKDLEEEVRKLKKQEDELFVLKYNIDAQLEGRRSVETTWIRPEIDKSVAIFYFAVIVTLFTAGIIINSTFVTTSVTNALNSLAQNNSSSTNSVNSTFIANSIESVLKLYEQNNSSTNPLNSTHLANSIARKLNSSTQDDSSSISRHTVSNFVLGLQVTFVVLALLVGWALLNSIRTLMERIRIVWIYMIATKSGKRELKEYIEKVHSYI